MAQTRAETPLRSGTATLNYHQSERHGAQAQSTRERARTGLEEVEELAGEVGVELVEDPVLGDPVLEADLLQLLGGLARPVDLALLHDLGALVHELEEEREARRVEQGLAELVEVDIRNLQGLRRRTVDLSRAHERNSHASEQPVSDRNKVK